MHDRLKEQGYPVVSVNAAESPCTKCEGFKNKKAEMYWHLRGLFERQEIIIPKIPHHNKLSAELSVMKYKYDSPGKLQIVDPEKSPDFADALALACYGPIISARVPGVVMF